MKAKRDSLASLRVGRKRGGLSLCFLLPFLCAASMQAQERFSEMIAVTEVEVPVRVLVRGEPLVGLTREDFEVYDRGVLQTIVGFSVRHLHGTVLEMPAEAAQSVPVDRSGRRLMLLFDFGFSRRFALVRAMRGIRTMLDEQLEPADRVAVATWGPVSGMNLLVGFTRDRAKTSLALDAIDAMLDAKGKRQRGLLEDLHRMRFAGDAAGGSSSTYSRLAEELGETAALAVLTGPVDYTSMEDDGVLPEQRGLFAPIRVRVEIDVRGRVDIVQDQVVGRDLGAIRNLGLSLAELASLLGGVGGQKDILLLSEGFSGAQLTDSQSLYFLQKSFRALRDNSWTMHAIDIGGVPGLGESAFASNSLLFMSEATGGDLVENFNDLSVATSRVLNRSGVVYVLSFQPGASVDDGKLRKLRVRLKNAPRRVKVLHRPGYYASRPLNERDAFEQRVETAEWLLANLEAGELPVKVFAGTVTDGLGADSLGGVRVPVSIEIDGPALLGLPLRRQETFELRLAVLDDDRLVREVLTGSAEVDLRSMKSRLERGGVRFVGELGLVPGTYQLRVLVRTLGSGEVYLATRGLRVGDEVEGDLPRLPPETERPESAWLTVETERRSAYFR